MSVAASRPAALAGLAPLVGRCGAEDGDGLGAGLGVAARRKGEKEGVGGLRCSETGR